ncbi:MAG: D-alanyl-D-alanine carboxypeptidase [Xanthobacteraceae bacterium]|nr:D-alanyl-D-alanine carboxypeptidase [Xanthobacteraceae bacterium]
MLAAGLAIIHSAPAAAHAEASLLVEADSGKVLEAENATFPWHPASLTKVMTAYVTLAAVKSGRISLDTLLAVSPTAAAQSPSKMGFAPGTRLTVDNALKMMMVKSANDMAVVLAEGVGGSIDGFAAMMNQTAQQLGMTQTSYVNPNGLPDDRQVTSARDLAILARAFIRDLPEYEYFVHIPAIRYGRRVTPNFNKLIGRYPGADGMKTGFICASGFNLMATATQNGRRLIAVVLGASSSQQRSIKAIKLLDRGFSGGNLSWLKPALGTVDNLAPIAAAPPDLRDDVCGPRRKRPASDNPDDDTLASVVNNNPALNFFADGLKPPTLRPEDMLAAAPAPAEPVIVYTGPTKTGAELVATAAADAAAQEAAAAHARKARAAKRRGGKGHGADKRITVTVDTKKPAAGAKSADAGDAKNESKASAKNNVKSNAGGKPAAKPSAHASAKPAEKPSAHKPAAKPAAATKPAPKDKPKQAARETKPKN